MPSTSPADSAAGDTSLAGLPTASLALALGFQCGRAVAVSEAGRVTALVEELKRRGEYEPMLAAMGGDLAASINALYCMDRAQAWKRSGTRPPLAGKSP